MSHKNRDEHNRWRNKTVAFRVSPEEDEQLEIFVKLSGLIRRGDLSVLQQTIERAVLLTDSSSLGADDFYIEETAPSSRPVTLEEMEKQFIREVLREKNGNLTLCAQQLDISRQTLYNKMRKYGL